MSASAEECVGLPSYDDISRGVGNAMDHEEAVRNYLGLTLSEAEERFRKREMNYLEDLLLMGPRGFRFYLRALVSYLKSTHAWGDNMTWRYFAMLVTTRLVDLEAAEEREVAIDGLCYGLEHEAELLGDSRLEYDYEPTKALALLQGLGPRSKT